MLLGKPRSASDMDFFATFATFAALLLREKTVAIAKEHRSWSKEHVLLLSLRNRASV